MGYISQIILLIILIIINAFFSMSEMAIVSSGKNKIRTLAENGNKRAKRLISLMESPNRYLSTVQVCITLAGFLQSAIVATTMARDLGGWIDGLNIPYGLQIAVVLTTLILAYFNLVLGELVPKRIGLHYPERIALAVCGIINVCAKFTAPFVWLLSKSVAGCLRLFGIRLDKTPEVYSEDEIISHLDVGIETGEIDEAGADMIASVFEFDDKLAYEIMTPRTDIFMRNINEPLSDYADDLINSRHIRIPFYERDRDDIVGVLYMKDYYIKAKTNGWNRVAIRKLLRKPYFVPESKNINELFREMQERREHMAFLVDEYGGLSGMVTTEDIVEEVMGAMNDEYDDTEPKIEKLGDRYYELDGNYYLDDLNELFEDIGIEDLRLESNDYETIGGLLIDQIGEIPDDDCGESHTVELGPGRFTVMSWKERRIEKVKMEILPESFKAVNEDQPDGDIDG